MSQYYRQVSRAFDHAAPTYDDLYQQNQVMAWMRTESLAALRGAFPPNSHLLEIGCGTGEEAMALSQAGYRIVATDISPAMIHAARAKAEATGVTGTTWRVLPAGQLSQLAQDYEPAYFDGAYSSYGALNCEPQLEQLAIALAGLLQPGAPLVCSVMNRWCAWEIGWSLVHLRPREAFRRLGREWVQAGLSAQAHRLTVPTRYYGPRSFARAFAPYFQLRSVRGLPVFLPPPYLDHLLDRFPALFSRLERIERHLQTRFPFHSLGDHFQVTMIRAEVDKG
jgi:ubiquinone/menaquinone biosynthesis C-methylase UbiE